MDNASWYHKRLTRRKVDCALLKIDQQSPGYDVKELTIPIVFVPMVFAFNDPNPNNRVIHFTSATTSEYMDYDELGQPVSGLFGLRDPDYRQPASSRLERALRR